MENEKFDRDKAKRLCNYTQEVFFRRSRPITGTEDSIRAPPIITDFAHLERICSEFDLPMDIFYDKEEDVERNWRNFCEFLLDETIPESLKHLSGETYPVLRTISQMYEAIKECDLPFPRSRYPFKSEKSLAQRMFLYLESARDRTRSHTCPSEVERIKIVRESLFLTKEELATRTGLSKSYFTRLEKSGGFFHEHNKLWDYQQKVARALYGRVDSITKRAYLPSLLAYKLDKRFSQFLWDNKIPSFSRGRLPRPENIHPHLKFSVAGLYFILRNYDKGNNPL